MGRTKQNPEDSGKRALILEAAGRMFTELGYDAVSMDALAEAAPVSKPTLYNHFGDKKSLFTAVMETRCLRVFEAFEALDGQDPAAALRSIARRFLDLVLSPQAVALHRTIVSEAMKFPDLGQLFYESGPRRVQARLAEWLEAQSASGRLSVPDPMLSASLFIGMVKSHAHLQSLLGLQKELGDAERRKIVDYTVEMFLKGHDGRRGAQ